MKNLIEFATNTLAIIGVYFIIDKAYDTFIVGDGLFTRISSFISRIREKNGSREKYISEKDAESMIKEMNAKIDRIDDITLEDCVRKYRINNITTERGRFYSESAIKQVIKEHYNMNNLIKNLN